MLHAKIDGQLNRGEIGWLSGKASTREVRQSLPVDIFFNARNAVIINARKT